MVTKRVALVLSGGVSLGSYIAGALDELVAAFEASHQSATGPRYVVDVITGASAGATTAAVLAHGLLYQAGKTRLAETWVSGLDIVDLLDPRIKHELSVLNPNRLYQLADEVLAVPEPSTWQRAQSCAATLYLAMTIANIDPLIYQNGVFRAVGRNIPFLQERHAEQETYRLTDDVSPTDPLWQRAAHVAIASAALPYAFPLVRLRRDLSDPLQYIEAGTLNGPVFNPGTNIRECLYADGGAFNNLPIDLAWHYVRQIDQTEGDKVHPDRMFVLVDPSPDMANMRVKTARYPGLIEFTGKFFRALRAESSAIQFERTVMGKTMSPPLRPEPVINQEPDDTLVPKILPGQTILEPDNTWVPRILPGQMLETNPPLPADDLLPQLLNLEPRRAELAPVMSDGETTKTIPGINQAPDSLFQHFCLVTPDTRPLRGSYLIMALSGFLDERFRMYDYRRGAADARETARIKLGIIYERNDVDAAFYTPDQDATLGPSIPDYAALDQIPSTLSPDLTVKAVFERAVRERLSALIGPLVTQINPPGPNFLYRWLLRLLLWFGFGGIRERIETSWDA
jgi:predicted acylesterase/phospholipase RssA